MDLQVGRLVILIILTMARAGADGGPEGDLQHQKARTKKVFTFGTGFSSHRSQTLPRCTHGI